MIKFWHVAWYEYRRHVYNKRFLLAILSVPLVMVLMVGLIFLIVRMENDYRPVGYVDQSGLLADPVPAPPADKLERQLEMRPFTDEAAAQAALEAGEIQTYYLIPANYFESYQMTKVIRGKVGENSGGQFADFIRVNLLAHLPPDVAARVTETPEVIFRSLNGGRENNSYGWVNLLLGFVFGIGFMIMTFTTSGYLLQAVVEEKENRTMEVLITSISPLQLMGGKVMGIIAVGLTQFLGWALFFGVGFLIGREYISFLADMARLQFDLAMIGSLLLVLLPAYVMISALLAAIGATVAETSEGQQMTALVTFPVLSPLYFLAVLVNSPNSPLALALSFFPLTAPMTTVFRVALTDVPWWQIGVSLAVLVLSAAGALWEAGRAFRIGMVRYGQRVRLKEVFARRAKA